MKHEFIFRPAAQPGALALLCLTGISLAAPHYTDLRHLAPVRGSASAGATKAASCFACHGATGAPIAPTFPRLAGQRAEYLYHRMVSFRHASPGDPYYSKSPMTPLMANVSDQDMRDLAAFFAAQAPTPAAGVQALPAAKEGEGLFTKGDPTKGIPPCQGCHGADANGPILRTGQYAAYPSLRGQSSLYLVSRLTSFREDQPSDTSNTFIMGGVAHSLDDNAIQALAAWLSSLPPVPAP